MSDFAPWEPPFAGTESAHLAGMLDRLRATFYWKVEGLSSEQLRFTLDSSALSLGVLLKHLACCEDEIFQWKMLGKEPPAITACPRGTDLHTWQFTLSEEDTAERLYGTWAAAVRRSRETLAAIIAADRLDEPAHLRFPDVVPSKRRFVCDFIEELGRHTGHADLIREALDGRVGEDPDGQLRLPY